jgi:hypothetical protein
VHTWSSFICFWVSSHVTSIPKTNDIAFDAGPVLVASRMNLAPTCVIVP